MVYGVALPEDGSELTLKGSDKVDSIELIGLPCVTLLTILDKTFKAGGIPARANGAITKEGNNGKAKRKVAKA